MLSWMALMPALLFAGVAPAPAEPPAGGNPAAAVAGADRPGVDVAIEVRRDRYRYRFENPSSFDTPDLVPHFFEQSYRVDSRWLVVRGRYLVRGRLWSTEVGLTPSRLGYGDDYDTFYNPDGNLVVYGTKADTSIRSWRFVQSFSLARVAGFETSIGYGFRRDRAVFPASYSTTTQSRPPSFSSVWNAGRETTVSDLHEVRVGAGGSIATSSGTRFGGRVDLTPIGLARLATYLPDKYPDGPIVFAAKGPSIAVAFSLERHLGRLRVGASADYVHSWSYGSSNQFHRDSAGFRITAGF
jgi:hypothetical protein